MHRLRRAISGAVGVVADALVPAALTAAGFALVAAGLLTYLSPVAAAPLPTPSATPSSAGASQATTAHVTLPPGPSGSMDPSKNIPTRIVVPVLSIDLAVIPSPPNEKWPICGAAEYLTAFSLPGSPGATFIYSHARTGMFLPLLTTSISNADSMRGMLVWLYTDNDLVFTYEVTKVIRHHTPDNLDDAFAVKTPQLWMQTSEGPYAS